MGSILGEFPAVSAAVGVVAAGTAGSSSTDVVVKLGTSLDNASVDPNAKLVSVRTGIGGTESEKLSILKSGDVYTGGILFAAGTVTGSNLSGTHSGSSSGTNTGDQTISLTGDVTGSGTGSMAATIGTGAVTLAKMANMATGSLLGRSTAGTGAPEVITVGSGLTLSGGTLTAAGGGGVSTVSVTTANGVSGSVANPTTTPAITLTLGAITPTSVAASGTVTGSNLSGTQSGTNTGDLSLGAVGSTANANGASLAAQVLTLQPASGTLPGVLTAGAQTIGGAKTFSGAISASNLSGTNTGDQTITLSGDLSGSGTTSVAATIAAGAVSLSKMANMATNSILGRSTAGTGAPEVITIGSGLTLSAGTLTASGGGGSTTLTGDVTGTGTGTFATTIATASVSLAKMANMATASLLGRSTAGTGVPEVISVGAGLTLTGGVLTSSGTGYSVTQNTFLGRASAGAGSPETISVGSGLSMAGGVLITAPSTPSYVKLAQAPLLGGVAQWADWGHANRVIIRDVAGAHDLVTFGTPGVASGKLHVLVSKDQGATWAWPTDDSYAQSVTTSNDNGVAAVAQDSAGTIHFIYRFSSGSYEYRRCSPTRDSAGHVTGYTGLTAGITMEGLGTFGADRRSNIEVVIDGTGTERLAVLNICSDSATGTFLEGWLSITANLAPSAAASFTSLTGTATSSTRVLRSATTGGGGAHDHTIDFAQHGTSRDLYFFGGNMAADAAPTVPLTTDWVRLTVSGSTWTAGSLNVGTWGAGTFGTNGSYMFGAYGTTNYVWVMLGRYDDGSVRFGRINAAGTYEEPVATIPSPVSDTRTGMTMFGWANITEDGCIWAHWSRDSSGTGNWYDFKLNSAMWNGSVWTVYNDPVAHGDSGSVGFGDGFGGLKDTNFRGAVALQSRTNNTSFRGLLYTAAITGGQLAAAINPDSINMPALTLPTNPATPATGMTVFGRAVSGRAMPAFINSFGEHTPLQASFARNKIAYAQPNGNGTTISSTGLVLTATGTATAANWASTNLHTSTRRLDYLVTVAATTAVAGFRGAAQQFWRGNAAGLGGFHYICRWAPATGQATATRRAFCGLAASTSAPTDVNPSTLLNILGMGFDNGDANMQFMCNDGTATATKINLGASFAVSATDRAKVYEIALFSPANGTTIYYEIMDVGTGAVATGSVTTKIPSNTTALNPWGYCSVGGTSSVVGMTLFNMYIETDT